MPPHGLQNEKSNLDQFLRVESHDDYCLSTHDDTSMCDRMCPRQFVFKLEFYLIDINGEDQAMSTEVKSSSDILPELIPVKIARYSDPMEIMVSLELFPVP